jgi:ankyrin repeat protein
MTSSSRMYGAIARNDAGAVRALVATDLSVLSLYSLENSWLHLAAQMGRIEIMDALIGAGMRIDQLTSDRKRTPLDTAAGQGNYQACEWLLNHGADINHGLGELATPIFSVVFSKSPALVELFADRGANLSASFGNPGIDLIRYAEQYGTSDIVTFLQSRTGRLQS